MDISTPHIAALMEVVMGGKKYTAEFKIGATKQVVEHGRPVREVASRL